MYSHLRWEHLIYLFTTSYYELYSLPLQPLLHVGLSAGLTVLKTPSCHSKFASSSGNASSSMTSVCPICSTELNELARGLPYAHHTQSYVDQELWALPNGRAYGVDRLLGALDPTKPNNSHLSAKVKRLFTNGEIKDPTTGEIFHGNDLKRVYIS